MLGFLATLAIIKVYSFQLKNSLTHKASIIKVMSCAVAKLFIINYLS